MRRHGTTLVTRDSVTGLRRNPVRWPDGHPPTPSGCRWCGHEQRTHYSSYVNSVGLHTWTLPTLAQIRARMKARQRAREAARAETDRLNEAHALQDWILAWRPPSWPTGPDDVES